MYVTVKRRSDVESKHVGCDLNADGTLTTCVRVVAVSILQERRVREDNMCKLGQFTCFTWRNLFFVT